MTIFEILTLFPRMLEGPLSESLIGKARAAGLIDVRFRDIRDYAEGRHKVCDDTPYGGGAGMVMKPEPLVAAIEAARAEAEEEVHVILLTPQGRVLDQSLVRSLTEHRHLVLICGRYEGVDERVRDFVDEEISIGDFVLSGGEPAALVVVDSVFRLLPGTLGNEVSAASDSFSENLLEYPQFTRPAEYRGRRVPEVLLSGDHAKIDRWRRKTALLRTRERRADLFEKHARSKLDDKLLAEEED